LSASVNVFTYGSLMYEAVWSRVVRGQYPWVAARLPGFRRLAIRDAAYPAVVPGAGGEVLGRLWLGVSPADAERLDIFEGAEYLRQEVRVLTAPADRAPDLDAAKHSLQRDCGVTAQCYVWREPARLLAQPWDAAAFEREHLATFAQCHGADEACHAVPAASGSKVGGNA